LAAYLALAYAWAWLFWIPTVLSLASLGRGRGPGDRLLGIPWWATLGALIGGYGPSIAAILLVALENGRQGIRDLLSRFTMRRMGRKWCAVALLLPSVLLSAALAIEAVVFGDLPGLSLGRAHLIAPALLFAVPFGPLGEELGMRGYLLPRLQSRHSPLVSSVLLGVAWTFWHTPLFWAPAGTTLSGAPVTLAAIALYCLENVASAIVGTWIFNNSRGSILPTTVFHAAWNQPIMTFLMPRLPEPVLRRLVDLVLIPLVLWATICAILPGMARPRE
jgi:membrane protease YdiL (CAAX protease family)